MIVRKQQEEQEHKILSPFAAKADESRGRMLMRRNVNLGQHSNETEIE